MIVQMPGGTAPATVGRPDRVTVAVYAQDLVLHIGIVQQLRQRPELELVSDGEADGAQISLVVVDSVDDEVTALLQRLQRNTGTVPGWSWARSSRRRCNG